MFKQVLVMIFSSFISHFLTLYILRKNYKRFYFINGIIKYPLNCTIKNAVYMRADQLKNLDNFIFYSNEITESDNYIHDKNNNQYYLVEAGYYYYINKSRSNLKLHFSPNSFIFYLKIK
jgi:hypothetical protein